MNLFERIKNIRRNNLQEEKMKFPGGTADIGFTAPKRQEKVQKRLSRADKLGTPDPFDADYDKKVKKVDGRTKTGKVFKSTKPVTTSAPGFGKGDTPGQTRVKGLEKKAFKKTQPSDIKLPKSFTDFQRNLQDYKSNRKAKNQIQSGTFNYSKNKKLDKEISRRRSAETTRGDAINRAMGTSGSTEGAGGANTGTKPQKPKVTPTKGVNQAEVSKKAKDFTKQINQNRISSGTPMRKGATNVSKDAAKDIQVKKMRDRVNQLVGEREKMRSVTGKKNVKGMRTVNKQIKQYQQSIKSNPFAPTVYDKKNKPKNTFAQIKADRATRKIEKKFAKELSSKQKLAKTFAPATKADRQFFKATTRVTNPIVKRFAPGAKPVVKKGLKFLTKLGTPGRIAGATGLALLSPGVRKTATKFVTAGLAGAGIGALAPKPKKPITPSVKKVGINLSQKDNK